MPLGRLWQSWSHAPSSSSTTLSSSRSSSSSSSALPLPLGSSRSFGGKRGRKPSSPGAEEEDCDDLHQQIHTGALALTTAMQHLTHLANRRVRRNLWRAGAALLFLGALLYVSGRPFVGPSPEEAASGVDLSNTRVLVGVTVGQGCMHRVDKLVRQWDDRVHFYLFHYDSSDWSHLPWYSSPRIKTQRKPYLKMQFYKQFMTPAAVADYDYFVMLDCDAGLEDFDLWLYLKLFRAHNIQIGQPAVSVPADLRTVRGSDHRMCKTQPGRHSGRWTGFVECGPLATFTREAWQCIWPFLDGSKGSGWGADFKWCAFAQTCGLTQGSEGLWRGCGVIDATTVLHLDERDATKHFGRDYQPRQELNWYVSKYPEFESLNTTHRLICGCDDDRRGYFKDNLMILLRSISTWNYFQCECRF